MDWLSWVGLAMVILAVAGYLVLLFVIHDFTYRTWLFDAVVVGGAGLALAGLLGGGPTVVAGTAIGGGIAWFVLSRRELAITGSARLRLRPGDRLPELRLLTTDGRAVTDRDLIAAAPTLLVLYRGWWCPSHKAQLRELVDAHTRLAAAGLSIFAASVDSPEESQAVQDHVGDAITILCGLPDSLLDEIGARDTRGAPWYDRLVFGAQQRSIAMPAAIVIDREGSIVLAQRSTRVDARPAPNQILSGLPDG